MAKKEKAASAEVVSEGAVIYFIADSDSLDTATAEYLRDKSYITINGAWRKFKNFVKMAYTNARAYELLSDTFWRLDKEQQENYIIGSDALPIELSLMTDYQTAYFVGYDISRLKEIEKAYEKAQNISTRIATFKLES